MKQIWLLLFLLFTSCGTGDRAHLNNWARLNLASEPPTLDPRSAGDTTSALVLGMLFEGLTRINAVGVPELAAAESVEVSEDGKTYTFRLRESQWSNGDRVTASDFMETWKQVLSPGFPADYAYFLYVIKNGQEAKEGKVSIDKVGLGVPDDRTLVVRLEQPTPYFLELLATTSYFPVHRENDRTHPDWSNHAGERYICNGPFLLSKWYHSDEIRAQKNPLYWDADAVKLDGIMLSMIEDPATELHMFENGELDWAGAPTSLGLPTDALPALKAAGVLNTQPIGSVYYYTFNTKIEPLQNRNIRRALSLAIDRTAIVENILQAGQVPAMGLVPPTMPFDQKPFFSDHDLEQAKKLFHKGLKEIGIRVEELPPFKLSFNMGEAHLKIAQAIQSQWYEAFGINTELQGAEWKVYLDTLHHHDYMIGRMGWAADYNDPMTFLEMFQEEGGSNLAQWTNPKFTQLIERANDIRDPEERYTLLVEAERIIMDEMPIAPIYFNSNVSLVSDRLKGHILTPLGRLELKHAYIE